MAEIWKNNFFYSILRPVVDICTARSYRRLKISGRGNIPVDGVVLFAPNHSNALMDALNVLLIHRGPVAFGCRADLFRNKTLAKVLNWLKIIPVPRIRDGVYALKNSNASAEAATGALLHGFPYCLYSEGTHRTMRSLLPIRKGLFRTALDVLSKTDKPVYVVPVGLEYSDYFRYRADLLINIGSSINIGEFVAGHASATDTDLHRAFAEKLKNELSSLITYLSDDENYEPKHRLLRFLAAPQKFSAPLKSRLAENQALAASLDRAAETFPKEFRSLGIKADELDRLRLRHKVSLYSFGKRHPFASALGKSLILLVGLPYFLFCAVFSLPVWLAAEIVASKQKDRAFMNSMRYGVRLALSLLMYIIWAAVLFSLLPWQFALPAFVLGIPSVSVVYDYAELTRRTVSDFRYASNPVLASRFAELLAKYKVLTM